ncbi:MAG: VacB/RNase II family 3'-5' exoribonuclease [Lentisphaerae bacterium]|nr:VacB/RNase II family 3'-5' exoribonuclease [Lentisphaerota bacterium]MCP4102304.1 VacB/RNase II family 3'-5' exoribonuclease [Lentisphaerota bacterium]
MKNKTRLKRHKKTHKAKKHRKKDSTKKQRKQLVTGRITVTAGGLGFVAPFNQDPENPSPDIFIPPQFLRSAMDGDVVEVAMLPPRPEDAFYPDRGPAGKVKNIFERARTTIVGELLAGKKVRPLNKRIPEDISVAGKLNGAKRGEWVKVELIHSKTPRANAARRGIVKERFGLAGVIRNDLDAVCKEFKLLPPYTQEEDSAAASIKPRDIKREDMRNLFTVTIDPHDAKDFDDAVSIAPTEDEREIELGVHIADVAAYIAPASEFDHTAFERGFTAYLPGRTLPMLPKTLTAAISLNADQDSLAHSVMMTVNRRSGRITSVRRCHSTIRVNKRLTFGQVQDFIERNSKEKDWDKEFCSNLQTTIKLYKNMRSYRRKTEKFLEMSIPETRVLVDEEKNEIIGLGHKVQREADQMVEEFMLAANSEVAKEMIEKSIPGVFRTHPEPDPEKIAEFTAIAEESFGITPGDLTSRAACNKFLTSLPEGPRRPAILSAFLRSLPRALYQEGAALHFGLGKGRYLHFTSPIRRYSDLFVHQQLWEAQINGKLSSKKTAAQIADSCTGKEENNDNAYFTANDRLKLRYLENELESGLENLHEGIIAKVISAGMLVDIQDLGIYGFVPLDNLPNDCRRRGNKLIDKRGKKTYKCGDYIYLKLSQIDFVRGSAIFKLA